MEDETPRPPPTSDTPQLVVTFPPIITTPDGKVMPPGDVSSPEVQESGDVP